MLAHKKIKQDDPEKGKRKSLTSRELKKNSSKLDRMSRVVFPFSFTIFNVVYWIYYLNFSNNNFVGFNLSGGFLN